MFLGAAQSTSPAGFVIRIWRQVAVRVESDRRGVVPEGTLHGDHIAPGCDQSGGMEAPKIVQLERVQARGLADLASAVPDRVLMPRVAVLAWEQP